MKLRLLFGYVFFVKDAHGDVRNAYTSTGTLLADYTYTPWGDKKSVNSLAWAENNPVRYNGQYYDEETGMYYLRARYYDPQTRRFISEDPIKDGVNWYAYCGNNPVNMVDPSGLETLKTQGFWGEINSITNVEEQQTGLYGGLRSIAEYIGKDYAMNWKEIGRGAELDYSFTTYGGFPCTVIVSFDSRKPGTYGTVKINNYGYKESDVVSNILSEQDAYFYLKTDENNCNNIVVQGKISAMHSINDAGIAYVESACWDWAKYHKERYDHDLQYWLDEIAKYSLLEVSDEIPQKNNRFDIGQFIEGIVNSYEHK